jgi:hypothetical protein
LTGLGPGRDAAGQGGEDAEQVEVDVPGHPEGGGADTDELEDDGEQQEDRVEAAARWDFLAYQARWSWMRPTR